MQPSHARQLIANTLSLFVVWLLLSGRYNLPHMILGFMLSCVVAWLNTGYPHSPFHNFPWGRQVKYWPRLLLQIVKSSWHLTKIILNPSLPITPKLLTYRSHLKHRGAVMMLGNSITLTPGTITVDINGNHFIVHAIDEASSEDLLNGRIEREISDVYQEDTRR
jgi:multicomponent Na+:H+ antiporter subunit E